MASISPSTLDSLSLILAALFAAGGMLCLYASLRGSRWFFGSPNVRWLSDRMPMWAARSIYALLSLAILAMAAMLAFDY